MIERLKNSSTINYLKLLQISLSSSPVLNKPIRKLKDNKLSIWEGDQEGANYFEKQMGDDFEMF